MYITSVVKRGDSSVGAVIAAPRKKEFPVSHDRSFLNRDLGEKACLTHRRIFPQVIESGASGLGAETGDKRDD
jgi:hypothetical protein